MAPPTPMHDATPARIASMLSFIHDVRETAAAIASPTRRAQRVRYPRIPSDIDPREIKRANTVAIIAFVRDLEWTLDVPGKNDVLGYLADMGKDFGADSPSLRNRLRIDLLKEFEDYPRLVQRPQLEQFASTFIIETILARFNLDLRDVRIKANSDAWTRWKAAHGRFTVVGKNTGDTVEAIEERGRVEFG
jgi:hypothetical protein